MQCGYGMTVFFTSFSSFFRCLFYFTAVQYCFLAIAPAAPSTQKNGDLF